MCVHDTWQRRYVHLCRLWLSQLVSVVSEVGVNDIHGTIVATAVTSNPETDVYTTTTCVPHSIYLLLITNNLCTFLRIKC